MSESSMDPNIIWSNHAKKTSGFVDFFVPFVEITVKKIIITVINNFQHFFLGCLIYIYFDLYLYFLSPPCLVFLCVWD